MLTNLGFASLNWDEWEVHHEPRSLTVRHVRRMHRPTMQFYEMAHDGKSQTEPAVLACSRGVVLPEPVEDVREQIGADPRSAVDDADLDVRVHALQEHRDPPALRREFHRIREQVPDDLLQPVGVASNVPGARIEDLVKPDTLRDRRRRYRFERCTDHRGKVRLAHIEP